MLNLSVAVFAAGLALPVHSAEVRKLNPADLQKVPKAVQTPQQVDTGHIARPKPDLQITAIQVYPANPKKGDTVRFTAQVVNKGLAPSAASRAASAWAGSRPPRPIPYLSWPPTRCIPSRAIS